MELESVTRAAERLFVAQPVVTAHIRSLEEKVGARLWIARIMITWGILSGVTAMVIGSTSFAVVRFLLGVAEAGFFPGIVLYFTYWFPSYHHARFVSAFLFGLPVAASPRAIKTALRSVAEP